MECHNRLGTAKKELAEAQKVHGEVIQGPLGTLQVQVKRAETLQGVGPNDQTQVVMYQGNMMSKTATQAFGPNPEYEESIQFDIEEEGQDLVVNINNLSQGETRVFDTAVSFLDIKGPDFPINQEFYLNGRPDDDSGPRLLLVINYEQNELAKWTSEVEENTAAINNDVSVLKQVRVFID